RPRTGPEVVALVLALLAVITCVAMLASDVARRRPPGPELAWVGILGAAGLAARLFPWWHTEIREMTASRARNYAGAFLVVIAAANWSWHLLSASVEGRGRYLLPGALSSGVGADVL